MIDQKIDTPIKVEEDHGKRFEQTRQDGQKFKTIRELLDKIDNMRHHSPGTVEHKELVGNLTKLTSINPDLTETAKPGEDEK